ncbi:OmpA family protein [Yoonia sp. I 8.24]|uniref:OmpA family protein n=1 Tax=Yoonia sp. I 8.24 TaxID=1537229 RepID=UPI001EE0FAE9|nr:OmpA family protein [Yoonia sp. I 8.24]MCG3268341.1 OmpA family protein [Yoonia sp. I 8.24]
MKLVLVAGVVALTGLTFFSATQTLPLADSPDLSEALQTESEALEAARVALDEQSEMFENALSDLSAENLALAAANGDLTDRMTALDAQMQDAVASQMTIASLESANADVTHRITDLETRLAQSDSELVAANEQVAQLLEAESTGDVASAIAELESRVSALTSENTDLSDALVKRDDVISGLMASADPSGMSVVTTCQEQTDALLADTRVSFETGTTFTEDSVLLLEQIAMVAIDCAGDGLMLGIEGHTDGADDFASNLLLSDAQAKAVVDFLAERGVPTLAMRSVGFGDREPSTGEEQTQNQRILFDWKQG